MIVEFTDRYLILLPEDFIVVNIPTQGYWVGTLRDTTRKINPVVFAHQRYPYKPMTFRHLYQMSIDIPPLQLTYYS